MENGGMQLSENYLPAGNSYLYLVGVDQYPRLPRLYNSRADAEAVRDLLWEKYQFTPEHTVCHFDRDATQAAMINQLKSLVAAVAPQDTLVIYFAGHGQYDKALDMGYWVPFDGDPDNPGSYLELTTLIRILGRIKSLHTFVIADSCYAGHVFAQDRDLVQDRLESLPSRWMLTAGRNEPVSDGHPGLHSPFAQAVLAALRANQAPRFGVADLCSQVLRAVGNNARQLPQGAPLYGIGDMGGQLMFRLKGVPAEVVQAPLPVAEGQGRGQQPATVEAVAPVGLEGWKKHLKGLAVNSLEQAIEALQSVIEGASFHETTVIMLSARMSALRQDRQQGMLTAEQAEIRKNQLTASLLSLLDDMEENDLKPGAFTPE
ncbi:caspase family protein [Phaeodactylibacter luteus]|uniref:Caspase family protein n=2 Tax=Phaeodactylibacter luteus TaxID=1564516 RepID=A0A5C6S4J4_9BACT|nr:caspase family protein [Phaeodactylibacter luteus]